MSKLLGAHHSFGCWFRSLADRISGSAVDAVFTSNLNQVLASCPDNFNSNSYQLLSGSTFVKLVPWNIYERILEARLDRCLDMSKPPSRLRLPASFTSDTYDRYARFSATNIDNVSYQVILSRIDYCTLSSLGLGVSATVAASDECCCPILHRSWTIGPHLADDVGAPMASNPTTHRLQTRSDHFRDRSQQTNTRARKTAQEHHLCRHFQTHFFNSACTVPIN